MDNVNGWIRSEIGQNERSNGCKFAMQCVLRWQMQMRCLVRRSIRYCWLPLLRNATQRKLAARTPRAELSELSATKLNEFPLSARLAGFRNE